MLTAQRKELLLTRLARDGQIVAKAVSAELGLSEDTIRRDLRELAQEGKVQRVHGGALPAAPAAADLVARARLARDEKARLAARAARLVRPGQIVLLDGGTTARHVALHLAPTLRATVVTHSPTVASALVDHPTVDVLVLGGRLFKHSAVAVGAATAQAIAGLRADLFLMGVTGIHPLAGLSTGDHEEALIKRAMMAQAAETVVLASSEKLDVASAYVVGALSDVQGLAVDPLLAPDLRRRFERLGVPLVEA